MKEHNILDSGEIYKNPEDDLLGKIEPLKIEEIDVSEIDMTPLKWGGNKYKTQHFCGLKEGNLVFTSTTDFADYISKNQLYLLLFICLFVFACLIFPYLYLFGIVAIISPFLLLFQLRRLNTRFEFNDELCLYWEGKMTINPFEKKVGIKFEDIKAVQLIKERVYDPFDLVNLDIYSYEINLILKDNSRRHIAENNVAINSLNDAKKLSKFLNIPLYNGKVKVDP